MVIGSYKYLCKCEYYLLDVIGVDLDLYSYAKWLDGFELKTMQNVLQFTTGYRTFEQLEDFEDFEDYEVSY